MSSTYVHYSAPSSLPSDYAILSRYAASRPPLSPFDDESDEDIPHDDQDDHTPHLQSISPRRSSFPTQYIRPLGPVQGSSAMPLLRHKISSRFTSTSVIPNENTALLGPLVPRIEEEGDGIPNGSGDQSTTYEKYWNELAILAKYTLPVFGTHVLEYSLVIASVVSIGHLSTTALAASTLGSMTASVTGYSIVQGFTSTLDTLLPSAWTSSHPELVGLWSQRMTVVMAASLIPIITIWLNAEAILLGLRQEPEVARLAALYLKWSVLGLPAYTFNAVSRRYFQSQGLFTIPTRVIMAIAPLNAVLNYMLVWGPEAIKLGFIGAPIATAISFNLISLVSLMYGIFFVPKTAWHPISGRCFTNLGVLVQLGLAGVGQTASEWWSWELVGLAASLLGPVPLAAQSVLLVSASTTYQAPFALSVAASVRIGNLLGEQNAARAKIACHVSLIIALAISSVSSTMFLVFRNSWGFLFNNDPEVIKLVASILPLAALFQVFDSLAGCTGGILRARGKQFTGALLNLSAYYVIGIPFGIWLAFKRDMALLGLWTGLTVSLVYCATIGVYLCLRTDWQHEVQKVLDRLAADKQGTNATEA